MTHATKPYVGGKIFKSGSLEGRDFRSPNQMADGPEKTILGKKQKEWLFKTLDASEAKFKLVFSPTPIVGPDRKNKKDNHANKIFAHEGQELRDRLSQYKDLIVLCGDRHWQYASRDEDSDLWEFGCGPGSEKHQLGLESQGQATCSSVSSCRWWISFRRNQVHQKAIATHIAASQSKWRHRKRISISGRANRDQVRRFENARTTA